MSSKFKNLEGKKFGRLLALKPTMRFHRGSMIWLCRCDCGTEKEISAAYLGRIDSCGCARVTHGHSRGGKRSPEHATWTAMIQRCCNLKCTRFKYYGGRGIKVCKRWIESFENFLLDMGLKPSPKHSIERINNEGNYEPSNCRWATQAEQIRNTRRTRWIEINGVRKSVKDWATETGLRPGLINQRAWLGWSGPRLLSPSRISKG